MNDRRHIIFYLQSPKKTDIFHPFTFFAYQLQTPRGGIRGARGARAGGARGSGAVVIEETRVVRNREGRVTVVPRRRSCIGVAIEMLVPFE